MVLFGWFSVLTDTQRLLVRPGLVGFIDAQHSDGLLPPLNRAMCVKQHTAREKTGHKGPAATANAGAVLGNRVVIHAGKLIHFFC